MGTAQDDFERILERCSARLAEIDLEVPDLELSAPPRQARLSDALKAPAPPKPPPPPPPRPAPPAAAPKAAPPEEEDEVFPPRGRRDAMPPPPAPSRRLTPAPARAPWKPRVTPAGWAAAGAAAAVALGLWLTRESARSADFALDSGDALAVREDKGDLLVAQGAGLLVLSQDGRELGRAALDAAVAGMSWSNGSLWSTDGVTPAVIERRDGVHPTAFRLNHVPSDLYATERYLWTAQKGEHAIRQYLISRSMLGVVLQPIDRYDLPGIDPDAFAVDSSDVLWVLDVAARRLWRLRPLNGVYKPADYAPLTPVIGADGGMKDLSIKNGSVWLLSKPAGGGQVHVLRLPVNRFEWTPV